jgi:predicted kinase
MAPLIVPDPSLVLLVGAAGSGKSTLAARLFAAHEIVSSDALRAVVAGDEADQRASAVAFRILYRTLDRRLASGLLTVVDATNTVAAHRRPIVRRAAAFGFPLVAIVLDLPPDVVRAQNAGRTRIVDADVIDHHLAAIRATVDLGRLELEGFDPVVVLRSQEGAAGLSIVRQRAATGVAGDDR